MTYLDWNATAPLRPEAAAAITTALGHCGNPSSVHRWGRAARATVERARAEVAALVGAPAEAVVFVSGGTEANHLALLGSGEDVNDAVDGFGCAAGMQGGENKMAGFGRGEG